MKISIVIPSYNSDKYLEKCLESIFNQSYQDFEVIVVDAYSTGAGNESLNLTGVVVEKRGLFVSP